MPAILFSDAGGPLNQLSLARLVELIDIIIGCGGFSGGYGVREYIARRRRAAARKRFYDEHPDLRELRGL